MAEPEAPDGAGVVLLAGLGVLVALVHLAERLVVLVVLLLVDRLVHAVERRAVLLVGGDQLRQHPGQRVHLVAPQLGAVGQMRSRVREHPLEPEHQPVADLPAEARLRAAALDLGQRVVQGPAPSGRGRERAGRALPLVEERLSGPCSRSESGGREAVRTLRRDCRLLGGFLHLRSTSGALQRSRRDGLEYP